MNHVGRGGAALALLDLIREIKNKHHNIETVVITGSSNELNKALDEIGIENYSAPFTNFLTTYRYPPLFWQLILRLRYRLFRKLAIKRIERFIDFGTVDLIHSNLNRIDIGHYFSVKYNIPHFWHIREDGFQGIKLMQVFQEYNPIMEDVNSHFIVISNAVKQAWLDKGLPSGKIEQVYDGIDDELYTGSLKMEKFKTLSFVFVGGFHKNKGQKIFIDALGLLPTEIKNNILIHFYGDGPVRYMKKIFSSVKKNGMTHICKFYGYDPEISKKIAKYHIGVNCSKAEGFGRITVEYMMSGVCPFLSFGGANDELVSNGIDGLFFNRKSPEDICEKIQYLFYNQDIVKKMAEKARFNAMDLFTMAIHTNRICNLYKQALK